jgi:hypothetical protein
MCGEPGVSKKRTTCEFAEPFGRSSENPMDYFCNCKEKIEEKKK